VEVEFIPGKKAILTVYKDGVEQEKITLSDYNDKEKLHALFMEKGFEKYIQTNEVEDDNVKERQKRLRGNINQLTKPMTGGHISNKMLRHLNVDDKLLSKAQQKAEVKKKIKEMKEARKNFMMVGMPDDRP
jgi:hypothetical protein